MHEDTAASADRLRPPWSPQHANSASEITGISRLKNTLVIFDSCPSPAYSSVT
jgi:hypothetical protein